MANENQDNPDRAPLQDKLLQLITQSWTAQAAYVAAELGIPDLLRGSPRSSDDLAAATGTDPASLHRLLRAMTTIDLCTQHDDGSFAITPMGALLGAGAPESLRCWTIWWGKHLWPVWGQLLYSVRTGKSARSLLKGTEGFQHLENDPQAAVTFNAALAELTRLEARSVVRAYDFSRFKRIIDLGGGYGELLAVILLRNPAARGVLFDLPHATEGARSHFARAQLTGRTECVAGDFFQSIPGGCDAYILKSVLHDWNDDRCREILANCGRAMANGATLLLIERVFPQHLDSSAAHQSAARSDLTMLAALAAMERSESQFRDLLDSAGFQITRICPAGTVSVIEAARHPPSHRSA